MIYQFVAASSVAIDFTRNWTEPLADKEGCDLVIDGVSNRDVNVASIRTCREVNAGTDEQPPVTVTSVGGSHEESSHLVSTIALSTPKHDADDLPINLNLKAIGITRANFGKDRGEPVSASGVEEREEIHQRSDLNVAGHERTHRRCNYAAHQNAIPCQFVTHMSRDHAPRFAVAYLPASDIDPEGLARFSETRRSSTRQFRIVVRGGC